MGDGFWYMAFIGLIMAIVLAFKEMKIDRLEKDVGCWRDKYDGVMKRNQEVSTSLFDEVELRREAETKLGKIKAILDDEDEED